MPKIFALRHQLQEQQARLKQQSKSGSLDLRVVAQARNSSPPQGSSGDEGAQNLTAAAASAGGQNGAPPPHPTASPPQQYRHHHQQQQQHHHHYGGQPPYYQHNLPHHHHPHLPLDLGRPPIRPAGKRGKRQHQCCNFFPLHYCEGKFCPPPPSPCSPPLPPVHPEGVQCHHVKPLCWEEEEEVASAVPLSLSTVYEKPLEHFHTKEHCFSKCMHVFQNIFSAGLS